ENHDWSDLIHLTDVLNNAPAATYFDEVSSVIDVKQWLRYMALDSLLLNLETGLNNGIGDDYGLFHSNKDDLFRLFPHDLDTIFNQGDQSRPVNYNIFSSIGGGGNMNVMDGLVKLLND